MRRNATNHNTFCPERKRLELKANVWNKSSTRSCFRHQPPDKRTICSIFRYLPIASRFCKQGCEMLLPNFLHVRTDGPAESPLLVPDHLCELRPTFVTSSKYLKLRMFQSSSLGPQEYTKIQRQPSKLNRPVYQRLLDFEVYTRPPRVVLLAFCLASYDVLARNAWHSKRTSFAPHLTRVWGTCLHCTAMHPTFSSVCRTLTQSLR